MSESKRRTGTVQKWRLQGGCIFVQGGFTLIELIVVITILGILAAVAAPALVGYIDKSRMAGIEQEANTASKALQSWAVTQYAAGVEGNAALQEAGDNRDYYVESTAAYGAVLVRPTAIAANGFVSISYAIPVNAAKIITVLFLDGQPVAQWPSLSSNATVFPSGIADTANHELTVVLIDSATFAAIATPQGSIGLSFNNPQDQANVLRHGQSYVLKRPTSGSVTLSGSPLVDVYSKNARGIGSTWKEIVDEYAATQIDADDTVGISDVLFDNHNKLMALTYERDGSRFVWTAA